MLFWCDFKVVQSSTSRSSIVVGVKFDKGYSRTIGHKTNINKTRESAKKIIYK